jgi:hypothetical protein
MSSSATEQREEGGGVRGDSGVTEVASTTS